MVRSNGVRLLLRSMPAKLLRDADKSVLNLNISLLPLLCLASISCFCSFSLWTATEQFRGNFFIYLFIFGGWGLNFRYMKECSRGVIGHWIRDFATLPEFSEVILPVVCVKENGMIICWGHVSYFLLRLTVIGLFLVFIRMLNWAFLVHF